MIDFQKEIDKLNPQQKEAVETIDGPVMVIAGPGTGKTQMLALRIANILDKTDTSADNILCLTFTEPGAKAMRDRLFRFIGKDAYYVGIHTFHSFANEVIQKNSADFAFTKELKQLDEISRIKLLREIIDNLENVEYIKPFHDPYSNQKAIISAIQTLKKESVSPEELSKRIDSLIEEHLAAQTITKRTGKPPGKWSDKNKKLMKIKEFSEIYKQYQSRLRTEGFYDFEDMILFVINEWKVNDNLLAMYQEQYQYILVDEYQDTNGAQNEIINLLTSFETSQNVFVVGDDDQSIYRFQGANVDNILSLNERFSDIKVISTKTNYRSTQTILDAAENLIENNSTRLTKKIENLEKILTAFDGQQGNKIEVFHAGQSHDEYLFISNKIKELHENGVNYKDIAILYRNNKEGNDISSILHKNNIPAQSNIAENALYNEVLLQVLKVLNSLELYDKNEDALLYDVLLQPWFNIPAVEIYKLASAAKKEYVSFTEFLLSSYENGSLHEKIKEFIIKFLDWHRIYTNSKPTYVLEKILTESNIVEHILEVDNNPNNDLAEQSNQFSDILAINSFFSYVSSLESVTPDIKMSELLKDIKLANEQRISISLPKIDSSEDSVQLLTAHGSKGLEFEYVFIINFINSTWGSTQGSKNVILIPEIFKQIEDKENEKALLLEDERRLFFVALTRAREQVYITYSDEYVQDGNVKHASESLFLSEIPSELMRRNDVSFNSDENLKDLSSLLKLEIKRNFLDEEKDFIFQQLENFKLSPSKLNSYIRSPQDFLKFDLLHAPQLKEKYLYLGTALHACLEQINRELMRTGLILSIDSLEKKLEDELFKSMKGDSELELTIDEGKKIIREYYSNYYQNAENVEVPFFVEYDFSHRNIFLDLGEKEKPVHLVGRIDKLVMLNKELQEIKVVDYKNKAPISDNAILGKTQSNDGDMWRQLVFYKLLGDLDTNFRDKSSISLPKYNITTAEIDFLKNDTKSKKFRKGTFSVSSEDVEKLKRLINNVMGMIRNLEFPESIDVNELSE